MIIVVCDTLARHRCPKVTDMMCSSTAISFGFVVWSGGQAQVVVVVDEAFVNPIVLGLLDMHSSNNCNKSGKSM